LVFACSSVRRPYSPASDKVSVLGNPLGVELYLDELERVRQYPEHVAPVFVLASLL
jgi:hypothetical protein